MPPAAYPLLDLDDPDGVVAYLHARGWLRAGEGVRRVARAGEGNMNLVLRIETSARSLILKQARPWVEKYPQIAAPEERIEKEIAFYEAVAAVPDLAAGMPALLATDPPRRTALFEDLGDVSDFTALYADPVPDPTPLRALAGWLGRLHGATFPDALRPTMANRAMRALNHAHLFDIPLADDNGLDLDALTPGLRAEADRLRANTAYVDAVHALGARYLADGPTLLHGDFYPGSWVRTADGPRVIDPEFAFFGPAEYDAGVMLAHLVVAGYDLDFIRTVFDAYDPPSGFTPDLARRFAGMELMRRLIGVAQLPMTRGLEEKRRLLRLSERLVLEPEAFGMFAA